MNICEKVKKHQLLSCSVHDVHDIISSGTRNHNDVMAVGHEELYHCGRNARTHLAVVQKKGKWNMFIQPPLSTH